LLGKAALSRDLGWVAALGTPAAWQRPRSGLRLVAAQAHDVSWAQGDVSCRRSGPALKGAPRNGERLPVGREALPEIRNLAAAGSQLSATDT